MATPTIVSISPNVGPSGGNTFVTITGTNFRVPPTPVSSGKTEAPLSTVRVTMGGREATSVEVVSSTKLYVLTIFGDSGARAVVVTNLDDAGVAIPNETATAATGFTYKRPDLAIERQLTRVVRALLQEWKRQVLENTVQTTYVDYDADAADKLDTTAFAALPAIVLVGPDMSEDRFFSLNQRRYAVTQTGFDLHAVPLTADLSFSVILLANTQQELLNLAAHAAVFVDRNSYLKVPINFDDLSAGSLDYEMDYAGDEVFTTADVLNLSNVQQMTGRIVVRGVDLLDIDSVLGRTVAVTDISVSGDVTTPSAVGFSPVEPDQLTPAARVGPSPGDL